MEGMEFGCEESIRDNILSLCREGKLGVDCQIADIAYYVGLRIPDLINQERYLSYQLNYSYRILWGGEADLLADINLLRDFRVTIDTVSKFESVVRAVRRVSLAFAYRDAYYYPIPVAIAIENAHSICRFLFDEIAYRGSDFHERDMHGLFRKAHRVAFANTLLGVAGDMLRSVCLYRDAPFVSLGLEDRKEILKSILVLIKVFLMDDPKPSLIGIDIYEAESRLMPKVDACFKDASKAVVSSLLRGMDGYLSSNDLVAIRTYLSVQLAWLRAQKI